MIICLLKHLMYYLRYCIFIAVCNGFLRDFKGFGLLTFEPDYG